MTERLPSYGGQAVIEGVMMRGAQSVAIAMRAPNKDIVIHTEPLSGIYKSNITKIPFLRGLVGLWDALGLGVRALTISANTQTGEDEKLEGPGLYLALFISLGLGIGLFFLAPAVLGQASEHYLNINSWWSNVLEESCGCSCDRLYLGYWLCAGYQAFFAYHGAEHKTINAFESGAELTLKWSQNTPWNTHAAAPPFC
jgi:uncharacterized protein YqhQ